MEETLIQIPKWVLGALGSMYIVVIWSGSYFFKRILGQIDENKKAVKDDIFRINTKQEDMRVNIAEDCVKKKEHSTAKRVLHEKIEKLETNYGILNNSLSSHIAIDKERSRLEQQREKGDH